jgi:Fe-S cluster biogenesis protein NfuA
MLIQTEQTPNPNVVKFVVDGSILNNGNVIVFTKTDEKLLKQSPLAEGLFDIVGVCAIMIGKDFVSVTKDDDEDWSILRPQILSIVMDFLMSGGAAADSSGAQDVNIDLDMNDPLVQKISVVIEEKVRPAVAMDGGDIIFVRFAEGVVYLLLRGACAGCPSSTVTLKDGIERMLKHYFPEVVSVESVS